MKHLARDPRVNQEARLFAHGRRVFLGDKQGRQSKLRLAPGHVVEPERLFVLRPRGGLPMTVHRV